MRNRILPDGLEPTTAMQMISVASYFLASSSLFVSSLYCHSLGRPKLKNLDKPRNSVPSTSPMLVSGCEVRNYVNKQRISIYCTSMNLSHSLSDNILTRIEQQITLGETKFVRPLRCEKYRLRARLNVSACWIYSLFGDR